MSFRVDNILNTTRFPPGIAETLKWYVYRLVDPRNEETFYVGKGKNNRVFEHIRNATSGLDDKGGEDLKEDRIREIQKGCLEVALIIHRHGMSEEVALKIEAALIDAYPNLTNRQSGQHSDTYGRRTVSEIMAQYSAEEFIPKEKLILINIARKYPDSRTIYEQVRGVWRINVKRAKKYKLVLAHRDGIVLGAFRPIGEWLPAVKSKFPYLDVDIPGRSGFQGVEAKDVWAYYVTKRVPGRYRSQGATNPIRYLDIFDQLL